MDTSKEYILMCEKAEEIQKVWKPKVGDFSHLKDTAYYQIEVVDYEDVDEDSMDSFYYTWLPRQDQLQGMLLSLKKYKIHTRLYMVNNFRDFVGKLAASKNNFSMSMEQLWLAFVMHEKYGKVWSGTEWVKEDK